MFRFGVDVLSSAISAVESTIRLQVGTISPGTTANQAGPPIVESDNVEQWCPGPGFFSLPAAPTPGKIAAQVIAMLRGDRWIAIGARDIRVQKIFGKLKPGDTVVCETGTAKTQLIMKGADGFAQLRSRGASGLDLAVELDPANDGIVLQCKWGRIAMGPNVDGAGTAGVLIASSDGNGGAGAMLLLDSKGNGKLQGQNVSCQANFVAAISGGPTGKGMTCIGPAITSVVPGVQSALLGPGGAAGACVAVASTSVVISP